MSLDDSPSSSKLLSSPAAHMLPNKPRLSLPLSFDQMTARQSANKPNTPETEKEEAPNQEADVEQFQLPGARAYVYKPKNRKVRRRNAAIVDHLWTSQSLDNVQSQNVQSVQSQSPSQMQSGSLEVVGPQPGYAFPSGQKPVRATVPLSKPIRGASFSARRLSQEALALTPLVLQATRPNQHSQPKQTHNHTVAMHPAFPPKAVAAVSSVAPLMSARNIANTQRTNYASATDPESMILTTRQLMIENLRLMNDLSSRAIEQMHCLQNTLSFANAQMQVQQQQRSISQQYQMPLQINQENPRRPDYIAQPKFKEPLFPEPTFENQSYRVYYSVKEPVSPEKLRSEVVTYYRVSDQPQSPQAEINIPFPRTSEASLLTPEYKPVLSTITEAKEDVTEQHAQIAEKTEVEADTIREESQIKSDRTKTEAKDDTEAGFQKASSPSARRRAKRAQTKKTRQSTVFKDSIDISKPGHEGKPATQIKAQKPSTRAALTTKSANVNSAKQKTTDVKSKKPGNAAENPAQPEKVWIDTEVQLSKKSV